MELALTGLLRTVSLGMLIAGFVLMPVAIAVAILRHHLYEIDRLISRTLAYALLTASLTTIYVVVVLILGQLYGAFGREVPSWAIAATTLGVAALFRPVRHAIQDAVDRRFNRQHYDAAVVAATFDSRLRDQVDRDTLAMELLAAVDQTMQPTIGSIWLRSNSHPTQPTENHSTLWDEGLTAGAPHDPATVAGCTRATAWRTIAVDLPPPLHSAVQQLGIRGGTLPSASPTECTHGQIVRHPRYSGEPRYSGAGRCCRRPA